MDEAKRTQYPFIALEGCDGVGKSTIRQLLVSYLNIRGIPTSAVGQHSWLDPYSTRLISRARDLKDKYDVDQIAQAYRRDRQQHIEHNIVERLSTCAVVADRSQISDLVYREALYGHSFEENWSHYLLQDDARLPDVIIYVRVDVQVAYQRVISRGRIARHYEKPADMDRITRIYDRVLLDRVPEGMPRVIFFDNTDSDFQARVRDQLVEQLLSKTGWVDS